MNRILRVTGAILLSLFVAQACTSGSFRGLSNPTGYIFASSKDRVLVTLREVRGAKSWGPMAGSYFELQGAYGFGCDDFYTRRYWNGKIEKKEDIDPPEAGRIGTIQAHFWARIIAVDGAHTKVVVAADYFEKQVGRRYRIYPHFHKGPVFETVESDTYFEYFFLTRLGALLDEKNMPPLKGEL